MKQVVFGICVCVFVLMSCGGPSNETIQKMADELCEVMELHDESDPMSSMEVASSLIDVKSNEEYKEITEEQLFKAMEKTCEDGAVRLKKLYSK